MEPGTLNSIVDLLKQGGYGVAAIALGIAGYLFRRLDSERDKVEGILTRVIPLTDKIPEAAAKLHEVTERLERLAERKAP